MSKWSSVNKSSGVPESMEDYEYVELESLKNKKLIVCAYELFESNKDVYDENNKQGIHILFELEDGEKVRVCTHALAIVKIFAKGDADMIAGLIEDREPCELVYQKTKDGKRRYPTLQ